jgi:hypothetical protein
MFQTDSTKLRSAASHLDEIKNQTLNALGRYVSMNEDLGGGAFVGLAAGASLKSTTDIATTGRHVSSRFDQLIQAMQIGANEYDRVEAENQAHLAAISTQS